jgi:hypothetical protein
MPPAFTAASASGRRSQFHGVVRAHCQAMRGGCPGRFARFWMDGKFGDFLAGLPQTLAMDARGR